MAAGPPKAMPTSYNGLVGQGGQFASDGQHILLQQLYSTKQGPPAAVYQAGLGPGQYSLKALGPTAINADAAAQQMQQDLHTIDQHDRLAQQQQQPVTSTVPTVSAAAPGDALMRAHPAVTGFSQPAQQQQQAAGMQAAAVQQQPGSLPADSPTSLAPAAGSSSPTPEASVPATGSQLTGSGAGAAAGRFKLSPPSRLPPPDSSELEAAAEYEKYLARWEEGATLAQRWHRLSEKGVLGDIVEEWEEWQHDLMLQEIQRHNKTLAGRARKHKRDEPEVDLDAPRQTRTRRVPQALQDYQVEAVTGTPEPPNIASHVPAGPNAGAGVRAMGMAGSRGPGSQQPHNAALDAAGMTFADTAAATGGGRAGQHSAAHSSQPVRRGPGGAAAAAAAAANTKAQLAYSKQKQQQHYDGYQQQQGARSAGHSNGYALPQQQHAQQHQQQQHVAYGRVSAAPPASQGLASWSAQPQQQHHHQQQQQRGQPNGSHYALNTQEMMHQILHMGTAVGSAIANNSATAPAGAAARMPAALPGPLAAALPQASGFDYGAAFEAFSKVLGRVDPVAFTQHISAAMQQQFQQQQ